MILNSYDPDAVGAAIGMSQTMSTSVAELLRDIEAHGLSIGVTDGELRLQGPTEITDADLLARIQAAEPHLIAHLTASARHPLTPLQRAYLLGRGSMVELGGASNVYHEIEGHWDVALLEEALHTVVARHPALRTAFTSGGCQVVHDDVPVHIRVRDLRELPIRAREQARSAYRERASHWVAPLDQPPLVHVEVSVLADDRMVLHVSHDRLVMDAGSMFLFFRAWWQAYQGDTPLRRSSPSTTPSRNRRALVMTPRLSAPGPFGASKLTTSPPSPTCRWPPVRRQPGRGSRGDRCG